jgi:mxaJ protein
MSSRSSDRTDVAFVIATAALFGAMACGREAPRATAADSVHAGAQMAVADVRGGASSLVVDTTLTASPRALRVCADPNNLPFSNQAGAGFENRIAQLVAHDLKKPLDYTWWAQRRGFVRNTLSVGSCDLVIGVPSNFGPLLTTQPYYRSTYVFLTRADRKLHIASLDDPQLKHLRIGVQLIGDDFANTPPAHALTRRGIVGNVKGYPVQGNYAEPNPPARIVDALAHGDIDVAIVWGPMGGYFAQHEPVRIAVTPVTPQIDQPFLPFVFDIAMGVRRSDSVFARRLDSVITRRRPQIDSILAAYGVPRVDVPLTPSEGTE